jgi:hypothetical protein
VAIVGLWLSLLRANTIADLTAEKVESENEDKQPDKSEK